MKKKQKQKLGLTAGGVGLAVLASLLTIGGIRLFGGQIAEKNDMLLKELVHIDFDSDFFDNAKITDSVQKIGGDNLTLRTYSYTIPDSDYDVKVVTSYSLASIETIHDFEKELVFYYLGSGGYIEITNVKPVLYSVERLDNRNNIFVTSKADHVFHEQENNSASYVYIQLYPFGTDYKFSGITLFGDPKDQPKVVK